MKKIYTLIICTIFFQLLATAQLPAISWTRTYGGTKVDVVNDVAETIDGGFLLVGFANSNDGDVTGHHGTTDSSDAWLVKTNANGILQWQKSIGGTGNDILFKTIATTDHGFVCIGETNSTNGDITTNTGGKKTWAIKIDRFGNLLWSQTYSLKISSGSFLGATDDNGFVFSASDSNNNLIKLNSVGNIVWQKNFSKCQISLYDKENTASCSIVLFAYTGSAFTPNLISHSLTLDFNTGNILQQQALPQITTTDNVVKYGSNFACASFAKDSAQFAQCTGPDPSVFWYTYNGVISATNFQLLNHGYLFYSCHVCGDISTTSYGDLLPIDESTILYKARKKYNYADPTDCSNVLTGYDYSTRTYSYNSNLGSWIETVYPLINGTKFYFKRSKTLVTSDGSTSDFNITRYGYWYKNTIFGSLFVDKNSNSTKDAGENFITNFPVICNNTTLSNSQQVYHNNNYFMIDVGAGSYTTQPVFTKKYYTINPTSKTSFFAGDGGRDTVNFALQPIPNKNDLQINAFAVNTARPGFDINYDIFYRNQGTTTLSGEVRFVKEPNLTYLTAIPLPSSVSGDTLIWSYTNLSVDSGASIVVKFNIPNTFNIFDTIINKATIYPVVGDETPYDNVSTIVNTLRGSYDPNDKNEIHNGKYTLTQLVNKEALLYTVRFQNTGNDTAFTVEIKDTLDDYLDMNSFEMVSASHPYKLTILDNKYCTWRFDNILLLDSNHNEPASHGYISYRILPKSTLANNTLISNVASIYFDFNTPVQTNIQETKIGNPSPPSLVGSVAGRVINPLNKGIPNVAMALTGTTTNGATTNATGNYNLDISSSGNYTIFPTKNNDVKKNNGVSAIDIILTSKHILNITPFNSPYKLIAADANNSKTITNIDVIYMKRLILGIDTALPGKRLWAFVDSAYKFPDSTNPYSYKDNITYTGLGTTTHKKNQTFIGVKLGDVNYDWNPAFARGASTDNVELIIDNAKLRINYLELRLPVSVKNFRDLTALQYTLNFNNKDFEFVAIENNKLGIEFNAQEANKTGNIGFLWADTKGVEKSLEDGSEIFTLVLKSKRGVASSKWDIKNIKLEISNDITEIEAWDFNNIQHHIILSKVILSNNYNQQINVYPNPTKDNLTIESKGVKKLVITDCFGRTVMQLNNIAEHQTINTKQWNKGIYIVSFDNGEKVKVVKE